MSEVRRSDSLDIEHLITHLESNGLLPKGNSPLSATSEKNVAGKDIKDMPVILNNNLTLSNLFKK